MKLRSLLITAIALIVSLGIFLAIRADLSASEEGLKTEGALMQGMARESVPYATALTNNQPTLIEFYADWCTTCRSMAKDLHGLRDRYSNRINFVMLNVDDSQWTPQLKEYKVNGVPQFDLLDAQNQVTHHWVGKVPQTVLVESVEALLPL